MNLLTKIITNYIEGSINLKVFEDRILLIMETQGEESLDTILEDIAYTTKGKANKDLISEKELKEKLKRFL